MRKEVKGEREKAKGFWVLGGDFSKILKLHKIGGYLGWQMARTQSI